LTGRHRWVEYAEKSRYNASQVPAEWHGWLHFITDHTGDEVKFVCCLILSLVIPYAKKI
jgi:NADH:ubiquinone oxidoreductase subunit